jgi:hypothetical protein
MRARLVSKMFRNQTRLAGAADPCAHAVLLKCAERTAGQPSHTVLSRVVTIYFSLLAAGFKLWFLCFVKYSYRLCNETTDKVATELNKLRKLLFF